MLQCHLKRFESISIAFQGDYIWIEPVTRREFDVAIGARVISADGRKIQVINFSILDEHASNK